MIGLMSLAIAGLVITGLYLEFNPHPPLARWHRPLIGGNLLLFVAAQGGLLLLGAQEVMAAPALTAETPEISIGMGLGLIGVGLPTALSTIAAGIAVGPVGAASLAVLAEKPEIFGRTLIYLGLAEGIAIYGLVMSILMLEKL